MRIVVTGTGIVGPLGCGSETVWSRLLAGQSGIRTLPAELTDGTGTLIGGQVPDREEDPQAGYDAGEIIAPKERKKMDRFIEFALMAAKEALTQAGWNPSEEAQRQRTATIIASGIGGFGAIADAVRTTDERGRVGCRHLAHRPFSPTWRRAMSLSHMASKGRWARR
ncbi:3-oxoacyl-(acyl-carrier-protein) synthase II, putative [Dickeya solani RNS 08.23.3.1.A]|nr:3-oxoacyl-(acyl-carrier-protein) synthase II, putative [Dickeya solani RNS 08.23.3.1.A]